jgi:hypothetical protein
MLSFSGHRQPYRELLHDAARTIIIVLALILFGCLQES